MKLKVLIYINRKTQSPIHLTVHSWKLGTARLVLLVAKNV